jgi:hypothetical protein
MDSAEAFDKAKGMQTAIQTMIPYCILNVQKQACGEKPLISSTGIMQAHPMELMLIN